MKLICWLAISSLLFSTLPAVDTQSVPSTISGDGHLFIEIWDHQDGTVISGKAHKLMIDFPTYNLEDSILKSMMHFSADPLAIAILGQGSSLSGDMGGGAASGLSSINEVPYIIGKYCGLNLSITRIEGKNVTFDLSGRQMVLEPGESWKKESSEIQQIQDSKMEVNTALTIWNHGLVILESPNPFENSGELI